MTRLLRLFISHLVALLWLFGHFANVYFHLRKRNCSLIVIIIQIARGCLMRKVADRTPTHNLQRDVFSSLYQWIWLSNCVNKGVQLHFLSPHHRFQLWVFTRWMDVKYSEIVAINFSSVLLYSVYCGHTFTWEVNFHIRRKANIMIIEWKKNILASKFTVLFCFHKRVSASKNVY
jgi:hypothetical protein